MKLWVCILLVFNCFWLSGQKSDSLENPVFSLGFNAQPSISNSTFGSYSQNFIEYKIAPRFVLNPGVQALIKIYRNWYLNINVSYTELGYKETISDYLYDPEVIRKVTHKDYYIANGFSAQYKLKKMHFRLGMNAVRFINSKKIENGNVNPYGYSGVNGYSSYSFNNGYNSNYNLQNSELDKWLFGITGGVGVNLKINNKFYFVPEAYISSFKPITSTFPGEGYYMTGINLSIFYKLK